MALVMRDAGAAKRDIKALVMRDGGAVPRTLQQIKMRDANNVLRVVFSALSASASPAQVNGYSSSNVAQQVATSNTTAAAEGGTAPFTYAWEPMDGAGWTIDTPAAAATAFISPALEPNTVDIATFRCKVTDASGAVAYTGSVRATVHTLGGGSGEFSV